jgi:hypothetical protein
MEISGAARRDEDFEAWKFANMFFESLRSLGDAGDSGILWNAATGGAACDSCAYVGDDGLRGLSGDARPSFPPFDRIASARDEDLGIFLRARRGTSQVCANLSTAIS